MGSNAAKENWDPDELSRKLGALLKRHSLNGNQLSQISGIPKMTVCRLLSGETTDPRVSTLKQLANHFDIPVDLLINGETDSLIGEPSARSKIRLLPLLDWDVATRMNDMKSLDLDGWESWQAIPSNEDTSLSDTAFALKSLPSMFPRFPSGSVLVFDPALTPIDGDVVLAKVKKPAGLSIRKLTIDPPKRYLEPIVQLSEPFEFSSKDHKILGVNVLTMHYPRKDLAKK